MIDVARTAALVKEVDWLLSRAKVYRLSEPIPWEDCDGGGGATSYVVVSAVAATFDTGGPEAMAWACDADGEFLPPDGGRGRSVAVADSLRHEDAIEALGFEVVAG